MELTLRGHRVVLVDVAGLRATDDLDPVEALGIARVSEELRRASCALFLRDDPERHADADAAIRARIPAHVAVVEVQTKCDLVETASLDVAISAVTGEGLDRLQTKLGEVLFAHSTDDVVLTRDRHRVWVEQSRDATREAIDALRVDLPHEVVCGELRRAASGLDALLGADTSGDVLETIFQRFCIGK